MPGAGRASPASRESSRSILATPSLRSAEEASGSEMPVAAACLGRDTELQLQPGPSGLRVVEAKAKHAPVNAESCALPVEARSQRADLPLPVAAGPLGGSSSPLLPPSAVRPALSAELLEAGVCLCKSLETRRRAGEGTPAGLRAAGMWKNFHFPKVSKGVCRASSLPSLCSPVKLALGPHHHPETEGKKSCQAAKVICLVMASCAYLK